MLEEGKYRSVGKLAEAEGVTRSFVNRLLQLTLLSPDIIEIINRWAAVEGVAAGGVDREHREQLGGTEEAAYAVPLRKNSTKYCAYISERSMSIE